MSNAINKYWTTNCDQALEALNAWRRNSKESVEAVREEICSDYALTETEWQLVLENSSNI